MKKLLVLLVAAGALVSCAGNAYTIDGTIPHAADGDVVYLALTPNENPVDSAVVSDGEFHFKGKEADGKSRYLLYNVDDRETVSYTKFYLEPGHMKAEMVPASEGGSKVTGTFQNDAIAAFNDAQEEIEAQHDALEAKVADAAEDAKAEIAKQQQALEDKYYANIAEAVEKLISRPAGVELLSSEYYSMEPAKVAELIAAIPAALKEGNERLSTIENTVNKQLGTAPGKQFVDFTMKTPEGKEISLSDYAGKGKLVLVDFWASWCGPCVREMPNVKKVYEAFKDKGFVVVGVSLDRDEQAWKDGIARLGMTWPQMSDIKYWDCEGAKLYGVSSIPCTVLIGGDGIIIERNLRGEALFEKVAELVK